MFDLSGPVAIAAALRSAERDVGTVDVLVNDAGTPADGMRLDTFCGSAT